MKIDALLSPAELPGLAPRLGPGVVCVVFDVLRATSTFITALHHGAAAIFPVREISEAVALRQQHPDWLCAGERHGLKILAADAAGRAFDLGNSPREFIPAAVRGRTIVSTTTNGTRALRACDGAGRVLAGSFLNLSATAREIRRLAPAEVILVCAGTGERLAWEDVLGAGALAGALPADAELSDAAVVARSAVEAAHGNLADVLAQTQNGRRLCALPGLAEDVHWCAQLDAIPLAVAADAAGWLRGVAV